MKYNIVVHTKKYRIESLIRAGHPVLEKNFEYAGLKNARFAGGDFIGANFRHANLTGADFTGAVLVGADFTGAVLVGATFRGAHITNAIFDQYRRPSCFKGCIGKINLKKA